ncbi:MAG: pantetheine-phosphate adenylyltransferase [Armatimonadetes bacterium]|nr:pantetheine-phosphate adenylyltransferase [Armatimonadota bacterium]MBI2246402.1 pantetheine-phosphate adenylyltransferase [Armatimonadota bacterium]
MTVAVYPGSFDPVHLGHLDVIERAARVFDAVIVAVARDSEKEPLFSVAERIELLRGATAHLKNLTIAEYTGLTVAFARERRASVLVKGLRAVVDFEYELKQASMNQRLAPELDTIFFMTAPAYYFLSSTLIREVARLGGSVSGLVPEKVEQGLREKFARTR